MGNIPASNAVLYPNVLYRIKGKRKLNILVRISPDIQECPVRKSVNLRR
jgi:hypothetical protein